MAGSDNPAGDKSSQFAADFAGALKNLLTEQQRQEALKRQYAGLSAAVPGILTALADATRRKLAADTFYQAGLTAASTVVEAATKTATSLADATQLQLQAVQGVLKDEELLGRLAQVAGAARPAAMPAINGTPEMAALVNQVLASITREVEKMNLQTTVSLSQYAAAQAAAAAAVQGASQAANQAANQGAPSETASVQTAAAPAGMPQTGATQTGSVGGSGNAGDSSSALTAGSAAGSTASVASAQSQVPVSMTAAANDPAAAAMGGSDEGTGVVVPEAVIPQTPVPDASLPETPVPTVATSAPVNAADVASAPGASDSGMAGAAAPSAQVASALPPTSDAAAVVTPPPASASVSAPVPAQGSASAATSAGEEHPGAIATSAEPDRPDAGVSVAPGAATGTPGSKAATKAE